MNALIKTAGFVFLFAPTAMYYAYMHSPLVHSHPALNLGAELSSIALGVLCLWIAEKRKRKYA